MRHCWVRLSECTGACMYSACASFPVWIFIRVCLYPRLFGRVSACVCESPALAYFRLCISVRMHVSIPFQLAANWETCWQHQTVWDSWVIWAVSGLFPLWTLLYTHCKAWKKGEKDLHLLLSCPGCMHCRQSTTPHSPTNSGLTPHHSAI